MKASIIRTTIKNENLLEKKMEKKAALKISKKNNAAIRSKKERQEKLEGVLGSKIEQSIARARYVQNARKAGWEHINSSITINNDLIEKTTEKEIKKKEEDEYVAALFNKPKPKAPANKFSLLEESEA